MTENGFTGSDKYEPAGIVHRGEFFNPCSCGGVVRAYWNGEFIGHTNPFDTSTEHRVGFLDVEIWGYEPVG